MAKIFTFIVLFCTNTFAAYTLIKDDPEFWFAKSLVTATLFSFVISKDMIKEGINFNGAMNCFKMSVDELPRYQRILNVYCS